MKGPGEDTLAWLVCSCDSWVASWVGQDHGDGRPVPLASLYLAVVPLSPFTSEGVCVTDRRTTGPGCRQESRRLTLSTVQKPVIFLFAFSSLL